MIPISFPKHPFKIKTENEVELIFDELRKQWLVLTPEEWVRQNFLQYLQQIKNYPASLLAVEKEIQLGELKKRCDILIYNPTHQIHAIVECKAMHIALDEKVLDQILRYNQTIESQLLIITNGQNTFAFDLVKQEMLDEIPAFA
jgi:hypothetical protein